MEIATLSEKPTGLSNREPIPGYVLMKRIGAGGYGEVWQASAPGGLKKAIKIVYGAVNDVRATRELKALDRIRQVHHPMLLSLERIEAVDDQLIVVTELADMSMRDCFEQYVASGRMGIPRDELLSYLRDAADGLDFLYERHSLQHLDVKPENLLLIGGRIKVADFGMVKDLHEKSVSIVAGVTPLYAPPELFDGQPNRNSDQYSLAVLYQEMLTGQAPFAGRTPAQIAIQQLQGSPVLSPLPRLDQSVVARALSKNPDQRFPNCRTFVDQLIEASKGGKNSAWSLSTRRNVQAPPREGVDGTIGMDPDALPLGPLPMAVKNDIRVETTPPVVHQKPVLRPTLIVGLGGTATKVVAEIRQRLKQQFGDPANVPCIRFIVIDTDTDDLNRDCGGNHVDWHIGEAIAAPLRSASDYREYREPLLEWLSRRWLYNIPRSLQTEGIRPLGRLAFVDHFSEIRKQLAHAIHGMMAEDSIQKSADSTDWAIDTSQPEVLVIGNVAGGTAGGALMDLLFTLRLELNKLKLSDHLHLLLLHCTSRRSSQRDLAIANTTVFLKEFSDLAGPAGRYPGEPTCGIPAYENSRSQFEDATFYHLGDELDDDSYCSGINLLADCIARGTFGSCAETIRQFQTECQRHDIQAEFATINSLGISSMASLLGRIPLHFATQVVSNLLNGWISPRMQSQGIQRFLNAAADDSWISLTSAHDDRTLESRALEILQGKHLDPTGVLHIARESILKRLQEYLHATDRPSLAQVDKQLELLTSELAGPWVNELVGDLHQILNAPGNCIYAASSVASTLQRKLAELAEQIHGNWQNVNHVCTAPIYDMSADDDSGKMADAGASARFREWAELRAAWYLVNTILAAVTTVADQLLEFARFIRRFRDAKTGTARLEDVGCPDGRFMEWAQNQVPTWVETLDREASRQLALAGRPVSYLVGQPQESLQHALELLGNLAYHIIESSLIDRSIESTSNDPQADNAFKPFDRLIASATPPVAPCGGIQRWGAILPSANKSMRVAVQQMINEATEQPGYEVHDPSANLLVFCHMSQVPVDNCISALIGARRELLPLAERLHTRNDLHWSPIG